MPVRQLQRPVAIRCIDFHEPDPAVRGAAPQVRAGRPRPAVDQARRADEGVGCGPGEVRPRGTPPNS
jgi:hypothetical protein